MQLFEFTYEHFAAHPRLISLLSGENLLKAKYLKRSKRTPVISSPVIRQLETIIARGEAIGCFRKGLDPLQLYVLIVSVSYFHLSNGYTLSVIFEKNIFDPEWLAKHKAIAREVIARYVEADLTAHCSNRHRLLEFSAPDATGNLAFERLARRAAARGAYIRRGRTS